MTRILLTVLMLNVGSILFSQVITGTVKDGETGEPVSFASLFFDGTFAGTTTDEKGHFEMDITRYKSRPLIISAVGYYTTVIDDFTSGEALQVLLSPRIFEIGEVSVSARSLLRKRRACMDLFIREFLGSTINARKCSILNEADITFNYGSDKDTLRAFASEPIRIKNLALGYEVTYYLDRFEYDRTSGSLAFTGNIIFNRDLNQGDTIYIPFERSRKRAYEGSRMHFFRTLWNNELVLSHFTVKDSTNKELDYDQIVVKDELGRSFLTCNATLDIYYYSIASYITPLKSGTYFEKDGFFDPEGLRWAGRMSLQRVADWLPYEYALSTTADR